jgi:uncharacterized protein
MAGQRRASERDEKGTMTVAEAGRKGGEKTAETHGHEFYQEIGHKGGEIGGQRVKELIQEGKKAEGINPDTRSGGSMESEPSSQRGRGREAESGR